MDLSSRFAVLGLIFSATMCMMGISAMPIVNGFECPTLFGLYPDAENCSHFYQCSHGISYLKTCKEGLLFNAAQSVCDWPANVKCLSSGSGETTTPSIDISTSNESQRTDTVQETTTGSIDGSGDSSTDGSGSVAIFECTDRFGLYPDENDCGRFWQCSYGVAYHMACQDGLYYNPDKEECDWPQNVKSGCIALQQTGAQVNVVAVAYAASEDDVNSSGETEFLCPEDFGMYSDEVDCSHWWHCSHGVAFHKVCPAGLHFNKATLRCDWPEVAGCETQGSGDLEEVSPGPDNEFTSSEPDVKSTTTYADVRELGFKCPMPDGKFSHSEDCTKFYQCSYGVAYAMQCPSGLMYNAQVGFCDWPENVTCVLPQ